MVVPETFLKLNRFFFILLFLMVHICCGLFSQLRSYCCCFCLASSVSLVYVLTIISISLFVMGSSVQKVEPRTDSETDQLAAMTTALAVQ